MKQIAECRKTKESQLEKVEIIWNYYGPRKSAVRFSDNTIIPLDDVYSIYY